jgi:predicted DNA-binding protein with PD1-like motif
MKTKLLHEDGERTFALIFETGDEVMHVLKSFAKDTRPRSAHFTAIGAFSEATLAYFDWQSKQYRDIPIREQVEVLTLAGDIAWKDDGAPVVHAHVVVGLADGSTRGGHLQRAMVRPTLEVILEEYPKHLERRHDATSGLALIRV